MTVTPSYLTVAQLREDSEFPQVLAKTDAQLRRYVFRAHAIAESYGPFVHPDRLDNTVPRVEIDGETFTERTLMAQDMRTALVMLVERLIFAAAGTPAAAAGLTSERIGKYEYSRSSSSGRTGDPVAQEIITNEIVAIFQRWQDRVEDPLLIERTDVFLPTGYVDELDDTRRVVVDEDFDRLAPSARQNSVYGERYRAPFG